MTWDTLHVEVPYLHDDGRVVTECTLSGTVENVTWHVCDLRLVDNADGLAFDLPREMRARAEDDLRVAANDLWGSKQRT